MTRQFSTVCSIIALTVLLCVACSSEAVYSGVNYGRDGDIVLPPRRLVQLLKIQGASRIWLQKYDPELLTAFAHSYIDQVISIFIENAFEIVKSGRTTERWVVENVASYFPATSITAVAVGTEAIPSDERLSLALVQTLKSIHAALVLAELDGFIKVSTPHSSLDKAFPPSAGAFNESYIMPLLQPILEFLSETQSLVMLNVHPFYAYQAHRLEISICFALFRPASNLYDDNSRLYYSNIFDSVVDAFFTATASLNHSNLSVTVTESSWHSLSDGTLSQDNSEALNVHRLRHVFNGCTTPLKPGGKIITCISEFAKDSLTPTSIRKWGCCHSERHKLLAVGTSADIKASVRTWCIAKTGANTDDLQAGLDYACGQSAVNCAAIQPGQACYLPNTVQAHASYAFNSYYQSQGSASGACSFRGTATITTTDPSYTGCTFTASPATAGNSAGNSSKLNASYLSVLLSFAIIGYSILTLSLGIFLV